MKVILLSSLPKVGAVNEVVDVSNGYAQNYLIPQGFAEAATERNIAELSKKEEINKQRDEERKKEARNALSQVNKKTVTIARDANELGTLFSAVSAGDVADAMQESLSVEIDESHVVLDIPIKEVGTHRIELSTEDTQATVIVEVVNAATTDTTEPAKTS